MMSSFILTLVFAMALPSLLVVMASTSHHQPLLQVQGVVVGAIFSESSASRSSSDNTYCCERCVCDNPKPPLDCVCLDVKPSCHKTCKRCLCDDNVGRPPAHPKSCKCMDILSNCPPPCKR
ncbi:hypothetical protein H6P81_011295 [Aristolochia fimbriata]|uniref:Bowman-Birk serine protease inhibitors family domain-containing protein n=1 Tax=Aristolochia fimbriata TaxID=158543 RepID=A0AAV7ETA8_ARIFI|nr:hypothetical protein H6P81_011295 [Aristolochia fimbriata]